jgi:predicted phosphodiesterase
MKVIKGRTLINPGEIYGQRKGLASWAVYDTTSKAVEYKEVVYSD